MENEREQIAKEISSIIYPFNNSDNKDYLTIADWHISKLAKIKEEYNKWELLEEKRYTEQLAKAKQEGRKEATREILNEINDTQSECKFLVIRKCQSILNEGASK